MIAPYGSNAVHTGSTTRTRPEYLLTLVVVVVVVVGKQGRFETTLHYGVHALSFHRFIYLGGVTPSIQMSGRVSGVYR